MPRPQKGGENKAHLRWLQVEYKANPDGTFSTSLTGHIEYLRDDDGDGVNDSEPILPKDFNALPVNVKALNGKFVEALFPAVLALKLHPKDGNELVIQEDGSFAEMTPKQAEKHRAEAATKKEAKETPVV